MNKTNHSIILIVEDSDEDFEATQRAFKKSGLSNSMHRCEDGQQAIDYLQHQGNYSDRLAYPKPNVILLDLNLPGIDGKEVLSVIKSNDELKNIPVIVLTTSDDERDIEHCYSFGANSYIKKPVDLDSFVKAIQRLTNYWFKIVILPNKE